MRLIKQTKTQVKGEVRKNGTWKGVIVPCKQYPVEGVTSCPVTMMWDEERGACVCENAGRLVSLETWLDSWAFHNTSWEEGYYAAYYKKEIPQ
jgi:hypothetical protein